jgi:penicillin-binding protein 1A
LQLKNNKPFRYALLFVCLGSLGIALYTLKRFNDAVKFINQVDLEARTASGASFYASQKRLFVGQRLSRKEVIEYLETTNFSQNDKPGQEGTYTLDGKHAIHITPRLKEFQPVTISFKDDRIAGLDVTATELNSQSRQVQETTIEPEPLGAFITTIEDDEASKMFVRRYTLQPADVIDTYIFYATLASEDATFMSHHGIRYSRLLINLLPGRRGGGSTISAQVVKNAVSLDKSHTVWRKIDEVFLTAALEQKYSKETIFTLYSNNVFLGGGNGSPNVYGFLAAAEEYFGKRSLKELTLNEACVLAAMLPKPSYFLTKAKQGDYADLTQWRDRVLYWLNYNWPERFPSEVIEATKREPVRFIPKPSYTEQPIDVISHGFVNYASEQHPLLEMKDLPPTEYSGLHVYCSVDPDLMRESQRIINNQIPQIERRFPPARRGGCQGKDDRMLGTIVTIDTRTGEILSMYGGARGKDGVYYSNFALNARGAPASTIKPFWVTKALADSRLPEGDRYTAASIIDPQGASIAGWQPRIGVGDRGRVRTLLSASRDDFAVFNLRLIGLENGKNFYETVTGASISQPTGQLSIGFGAGVEISPLQMAKAYSIYSRNGLLVDTSPISKVYLNGKEQEFKHQPPKRVADARAAFITSQLLRSVLGYGLDGRVGTARLAYARSGLPPAVEISGKTGSGPSDVWMVSIHPKMVIAVWLGYQCHTEIKDYQKLLASETAAVVWSEFIKSVQKFRPDLLAGSFDIPDGVVELSIDPKRGCQSDSATSIKEFFITGTEPHPCDIR